MKEPETQENNPERPPALAGAHGSASGLRACPLCASAVKFAGAYVFFWMNNLCIRCPVCGLETKSGQFDSEEELAQFWNERKTPNGRDQRPGAPKL